jgi:hypothetical protein
MELLGRHVVLVEGDDTDICRTHVLNFFEQTSLLQYDNIVVEDTILSGNDPDFTAELESGLKKNRATLSRFIDELAATGFEGKADLIRLGQGYQSKILHIIAHFLDGFIGIDSVFYNLTEDSHWLSDEAREKIKRQPERFRLLFLQCYSLTPKEASLLHT